MCRHIYDWNIVNCDVKKLIHSLTPDYPLPNLIFLSLIGDITYIFTSTTPHPWISFLHWLPPQYFCQPPSLNLDCYCQLTPPPFRFCLLTRIHPLPYRFKFYWSTTPLPSIVLLGYPPSPHLQFNLLNPIRYITYIFTSTPPLLPGFIFLN